MAAPMAAIDWLKIRESLNEAKWEKVSERWETRKVGLGVSKNVEQLENEAARQGMFLDFDDAPKGMVFVVQGRIRRVGTAAVPDVDLADSPDSPESEDPDESSADE